MLLKLESVGEKLRFALAPQQKTLFHTFYSFTRVLQLIGEYLQTSHQTTGDCGNLPAIKPRKYLDIE